MRRSMKLKDLARALKVRPFTVIVYEVDESKPTREVRQNLQRTFAINSKFRCFFR